MGLIHFLYFDESFKNYNISFTNTFINNNNRGPDYTTILYDNSPKKTENLKLHLNKTDYLNYKMYTTIYKNHKLAINDNTPNAHQPFEDPILHKINKNPELRKRLKRKLLCDGEIYNYKELFIKYNINNDLDIQSTSDLEIILPLYIKLGIEDTLNIINGDFAFILTENLNSFELSKHNIYAARDRYGIKPLWFVQIKNNSNFILFTSDINTLPNNKYFNYIIQEVPPGTYWSLQTKTFKNYVKEIALPKIITSDSNTISNLYINFFDLFQNTCFNKIHYTQNIAIFLNDFTNINDVLLISMILHIYNQNIDLFSNTVSIFTYHNDTDFISTIVQKYPNINKKIHYYILQKDTNLYKYVNNCNIHILLLGYNFDKIWNNTFINDFESIKNIEYNCGLYGIQPRFVYYDYSLINYITSIGDNFKNNDIGTYYIVHKTFSNILLHN